MSNEVKALWALIGVTLQMSDVSEALSKGDKSLAVKTLREINLVLDKIEKLLNE